MTFEEMLDAIQKNDPPLYEKLISKGSIPEEFLKQDEEYQDIVYRIMRYCSEYSVPLDIFLKELLDVFCNK